MRRRPHSFSAYARRRWRALGLIGVMMLGALLVATLTDRGHDPLWQARDARPVSVAVSDDASVVYTLAGNSSMLHALEARRGETGDLLWTSAMNDPRALLRAGGGWVAVATDFPRAFLTLYDESGSVRYQVPLEGNPRALAGDDARVAVALQAPGHPVLVHEEDGSSEVYRFPTFVNALDMRGSRVAVGTGSGGVVVIDTEQGELLNVSLPISVRSLRMNEDGTRLVVGGFSATPGDLSGLVAYFDLENEAPLRWTYPTRMGVGFIDVDARGTRALAVEESPPGNTLHAFDMPGTRLLWTRTAPGEIAQDDASAQGGVALSPDGRFVAVGTLRGGIQGIDGETGAILWDYVVDGTTVVAFAEDAPKRLVANARVTLTGGYDTLLFFATHREPLHHQLTFISAAIVLASAACAAVVLGTGYARVRRA